MSLSEQGTAVSTCRSPKASGAAGVGSSPQENRAKHSNQNIICSDKEATLVTGNKKSKEFIYFSFDFHFFLFSF